MNVILCRLGVKKGYKEPSAITATRSLQVLTLEIPLFLAGPSQSGGAFLGMSKLCLLPVLLQGYSGKIFCV